MKSAPIVTTKWRGGARIKIDRVAAVPATQWINAKPASTRFRVFAGSVQGATGSRSLAAQFYSGYHNGPKSERTITIPDRDGMPDITAILETIESLHRRWPKLWFYDMSGLGLSGHFPQTTTVGDNDIDERLDDIL